MTLPTKELPWVAKLVLRGFDGRHRLRGDVAALERRAQALEPEHDRGQVLYGPVVQLGRDAPAFLFGCLDGALEQQTPLGLQRGQLVQRSLQLDVTGPQLLGRSLQLARAEEHLPREQQGPEEQQHDPGLLVPVQKRHHGCQEAQAEVGQDELVGLAHHES